MSGTVKGNNLYWPRRRYFVSAQLLMYGSFFDPLIYISILAYYKEERFVCKYFCNELAQKVLDGFG